MMSIVIVHLYSTGGNGLCARVELKETLDESTVLGVLISSFFGQTGFELYDIVLVALD